MAAQEREPRLSTSISEAATATTFSVRLQAPGNRSVDGSEAFPDRYIRALESSLRAVPGLALASGPASSDQRVDYEIAIYSNNGAESWAMIMARSLGAEGAARSDRVARMVQDGLLPMGYRFKDGDTVKDLERSLEQIRMSLFPPDSALHQELNARLQNPQVPFNDRLQAL